MSEVRTEIQQALVKAGFMSAESPEVKGEYWGDESATVYQQVFMKLLPNSNLGEGTTPPGRFLDELRELLEEKAAELESEDDEEEDDEEEDDEEEDDEEEDDEEEEEAPKKRGRGRPRKVVD